MGGGGLGLLFLAVKPLRKVARMTSISEQVRGMTDEEAYYWLPVVGQREESCKGQQEENGSNPDERPPHGFPPRLPRVLGKACQHQGGLST